MVGHTTGTASSWLALGLTVAVVVGSVACGGRSAPEQSPETDLRDTVRLAQSLMNAGRVGESLAAMDEAIAKDPDNAQLHNFRGKLLFQAGRFPDAEGAFRRALELDPYLTDAHNFLGAVYAELGRLSDAEREYGLALQDPAYPTPELVYLNLGLLQADAGRDTEAVANLRRAVELNPKFHRGHFELASLLDRMGQLEEAAREYEVAGPGYRNVGQFHYRLGFAYFRLGQTDKARESLNRAIAVAPGSTSAAQAQELLQLMTR